MQESDQIKENIIINKLDFQVKKNELLLSQIQSIAHVGSWEWDIINNKLIWSDELYKIYGLIHKDFSGNFQAFIELIYPDDREETKKIIDNLLLNYKAVNFEARIIRPDGTIRYLENKAEVILTDSGHPAFLIGLCHDITDSKEKSLIQSYSKILEESNKKVVDILESLSDAFFSLDLEWKFTYLNYQAEKLLSKSREELIGISIWDEYPEARNSDYYHYYSKALSEQISAEFEQYFMPIGKWFAIRVFPSPSGISVYFHDVDERKRSEEKIKENEAKFRLLTEAIPQIVWTADSDGIIDYLNPAWYKYVGNDQDSSWQNIIHQEDKPKIIKAFTDAYNNKESFTLKCRFRKFSDDIYYWHLCRGLPLVNDNEEIIKWFGTCTDIDEEIRSEQIQKFLAEAGSLLISSIDYETTLQNISKIAVPQFADWCAVDMVKDNQVVRIAVSHLDPYKIELAKEYIEKYPPSLEGDQGLAHVIKTGNSEYFKEIPQHLIEEIPDEVLKNYIKKLGINSYIVVPLKLNGAPVGAITFVNDKESKLYTEKDLQIAEDIGRQASLAIDNAYLYQKSREAEESFRFLAESIPQQVWTALPNGALNYVNKIAINYFNLSYEEVINQGWQNVVHPDDLPASNQSWLNALNTGENYETEFRLINGQTNQHRWHIARAIPFKNTKNEVLKWFGTNTDIHQLKEIEEKLALKSVELENSNQELKNFAYVASHDLQEPLRTMSNYASLIERKNKNTLDSNSLEFLQIIISASKRMKNLIEDLLEYSQVGKQKFTRVDLNETIKNIISNLETTIKENKVTLTYENLPLINAISSQMLQLFQNLISNSIKYRAEKDPVINIKVRENTHNWEFSISDNGLGIESKYYEKIFVIFQRLHEKEKYGGTGIGLATCKKITEIHQGSIWLESELNKGTTFLFTIAKNL